ncbi:LysR family transcriptional regulator [Lactiplantibacillus pingfangensis]|uniref:LysR family transcriptional regulator n=1 Tax=Lactiplantibacillus pingfangensis TaxID=2559915 RepID=UPI0010F50635|nr:LysR family transcriptional regulator [Lactiplantibacillus pingfangensis]
MELQQLRTFRTIADTGSYTKAAQLLGYTQSTVSAQIKNLEQTLQAPLFTYEHRQLSLTITGRRLLPLTTQLLSDYQAIAHLNASTQLSGQLRIAAPESLTIYQLPPILQAFRQAYPLVQLQLTNATCQYNRQQLMAGEADIALMLWPELPADRLVDHDLGPVPMSCVVSGQNEAQLTDLLTGDLPWIINEPDCSYRNQFENYLWQTRHQRLVPMELWSIEAIKKMVVSEVGYTYLPTLTIQPELQAGTLRTVATPIVNEIHAHLLTRASMATQPLVAAFIAMARANWPTIPAD